MDKVCKKCKTEQPFSNFFKNKNHKDGLGYYCKFCIKNERDSNKEKYKEINKKSYEKNKNYSQDYYINNIDKIKKYKQDYRIKNKEKLNKHDAEYRREKGVTPKDIIYRPKKFKIKNEQKNKEKIPKQKIKLDKTLSKLIANLRTLFCNSIRRRGYKKNTKTYKILGCTIDEFKKYIEKQFEPWMNWENRGKFKSKTFNYGWDIDHIIPLDTAICEEDIIRLNHYTNLQPLCSYTNRHIKRNYIKV